MRWILVVLVGGMLGCGKAGETDAGREAASFRNVGAEVDYVGDAACFSCHEAAYTGYQEHGMARSFYRLTPENRVEATRDVLVQHTASGFYYTVVEEEDGLFQEEYLPAADGRAPHRLRRRMDYVMGSGNAARTYFTENNGRLYELPLTWYTQKKQWDFSPGYAAQNGRFDRLMPDRCMACHNNYPEAIPFVEGKYTTVPEGIGCERCHGPGALHVEERLAVPEPATDEDDTIVNPAHLSMARRLDVCNQCHLNTSVFVLREGRSVFSFQPSEALSDHLGFFVAHEAGGGGGVEVVSHAERMQQSACFIGARASERPLECITCHNPHEGFRDQGPGYFNDTCLGCHDAEALGARFVSAELRQAHAPASNCIACHMPKVAASDAPHSSFTDHWIRVVRSTPDAPSNDPPAEIMTPYFEQDKGNRRGQQYLGMALIVHGRQQNDPRLMATGAATLETGLGADTTHGEAYFLLGVAHQQLGHLNRAVAALERAVRIDPDIPQRLNALALAYEAAVRDGAVIDRLYQRALDLQPALADIRVNYGHFLQAQGRTAEAVAAYEVALTEQPWLDIAAFKLGTALLEQDRRAQAERWFQEAVQLNPSYAEVYDAMLFFQVSASDARIANVQLFPPISADPASAEQAGDTLRIIPDPDSDAPDAVRFINLPAHATVQIYTRQGALLRALEKPPASPFLSWDLRTETGQSIASGLYLIHVRARDDAGQALWTRVLRWAAVRQRIP